MNKDKRLVDKTLVNITKTIDIAGYNEDIILKHQSEVSRTICINNLGVTINPSHTVLVPLYSINCYLYDGETPTIDVVNYPNGPLRSSRVVAHNLTKNVLIEGNGTLNSGIKIGGVVVAPNIQSTAVEEHYFQRWAIGGGFSLSSLQAEPGDIIEFTLEAEGYQYIDGKYVRCTYPQQTQYAIIS